MNINYKTIDEYIGLFERSVQIKLKQMRQTIHKAAPQAAEAIKYGMPTFVLGKNLVHFAAWKNHIGFYPTPSGILAFKEQLKKYEQSKGAIQFPLNKPLPLPLVSKIVKYRVGEINKLSN